MKKGGRVQSSRRACGSTQQGCWQVGNTPPEMEEYRKQRFMSIVLCTNWVCAGTFDNYEWVSESTITEQEEEVMSKDQITKSVFRVWYNVACSGSPRQHG